VLERLVKPTQKERPILKECAFCGAKAMELCRRVGGPARLGEFHKARSTRKSKPDGALRVSPP
jgi:hypothetical protein